MKQKGHTDSLCTGPANHPFMRSTSNFISDEFTCDFIDRCGLDERAPPLSFPSWKLYENPFYVHGSPISNCASYHLDPLACCCASSFISAYSHGLHPESALILASPHHQNGTQSLRFLSCSADYHLPNIDLRPSPPQFPMAPTHHLSRPRATSVLRGHHELHWLTQAQEAAKQSDLANGQAFSHLQGLPSSNYLKCPPLHVECEIFSTSGEPSQTNRSLVDMAAACSVQATLASILQRLRIVEENQSRSSAAIAKMRLEMEDASSRIQELEFSHESALREINSLLQRFGEQMTTLRRKEQEKLRSAFLRLREEIEDERNTCRLLKLENKKLMKDLEEANNVAVDTGEELDRERQARELMEEVCNELAREIGEDKAEVEQLKQEQAKSREIVEGELKMMRMASLWQDEGTRTGGRLELADKHQVAIPLEELKSKIEEFVSTVSEAGCEPYKDLMHAEYVEEKQRKVIEQAKMLRQALESSMQQQVADEGTIVQTRSDINRKDEKILAPITQLQQHTHICGSNAGSLSAPSASRIHDYKEQSMRLLDLQAKPGHYMLSYSKKPCKDIRRPRTMPGDDHDYPAPNTYSHGRNHGLRQDFNAEIQPESGSGKYSIDNECAQARLHRSPSPEQLMYESSKIWLAPDQKQRECGLPADRNEPQIAESRMLQRSLSSSRTPPKAGLHRKQLSLHLDANRQFLGENADAWEVRVPLNIQVKSLSEDDASHIRTDEVRQVAANRRWPPNDCVCPAHHADDMHPWKSPGKDEMSGDGDISHHAECLRRHEYEEVKSLSAGREEGEEHGEFDGFYFEPVMDVDAIEAHTSHYIHGEDIDDQESMADDVESAYSNVYRAAQQSRSPKELSKSYVHDAHSHKSARYGGASSAAKSSGREEAPYKLVVPTPSIRVPLVKAQLTTPPKSSARSVSPSKPQVLQCFRPPPTSPEHHVAASSAAPLFGKSHVKAPMEVPPQLAMEAQNGGNSSSAYTSKASLLKAPSYNKAYSMIGKESAHQRSSKMGDGEASTSTMLEERKGNSLRAELLKARELDLQQYVEHVHYNMQKQAAATASAAPPPAPPVKSNASSSFRFSPLRKSLANASSGSR